MKRGRSSSLSLSLSLLGRNADMYRAVYDVKGGDITDFRVHVPGYITRILCILAYQVYFDGVITDRAALNN